MSLHVKQEIQNYCALCAETLCDGNTVVINEDILVVLEFISPDTKPSALLHSVICNDCHKNIKDSHKFKNSTKNLHVIAADVKIKSEVTCDETLVECYCCKKNMPNLSSTLPESPSLKDVLFNLIPEQGLEKLNKSQICEICQISLTNLLHILNLLSKNRTASETSQLDDKQEIYIKCETSINESNLNTDIVNEIKDEVKEEIEMTVKAETESIDQEFQIKQEELDLKMDCEEQPSEERMWEHNEEKINISEMKIFRCDQCEYQTEQNRYLKAHLIIHKYINKTEIFKCDQCEFQTKYKYSLKTHMLIHKNVKETEILRCHQCAYQTKFKGNLKSHSLIHRDVSEIIIFDCGQCEYQTKRKRDLNTHSIIHKNVNETEVFKCDQCEFQTKHKHSLKRHILTHKDDKETKVFKCDQCEFQTKHKFYLKKHKVIHRDESEKFRCQ